MYVCMCMYACACVCDTHTHTHTHTQTQVEMACTQAEMEERMLEDSASHVRHAWGRLLERDSPGGRGGGGREREREKFIDDQIDD